MNSEQGAGSRKQEAGSREQGAGSGMGGDFCFIGRQKRLRIGDEWYRVDLFFFHRRLRCLVIIDLKIGKFTHADAGLMHLYLNYARENLVHEGRKPTGRIDPLRTEERGRIEVRAGRAPEQGDGLGVSDRPFR